MLSIEVCLIFISQSIFVRAQRPWLQSSCRSMLTKLCAKCNRPAGRRLCQRCWPWQADWCYRCSAHYLPRWLNRRLLLLLQPRALVPPVPDVPALAATGSLENCAEGVQCPSLHALSHHLYTVRAPSVVAGSWSRSRALLSWVSRRLPLV